MELSRKIHQGIKQINPLVIFFNHGALGSEYNS
jgi:hypothetical protein